MEIIKIKPAHKKIVRDPRTMEIVPEEGLKVEKNTYWLRLIINGDVIVVDEKKVKKPKEKDHAD